MGMSVAEASEVPDEAVTQARGPTWEDRVAFTRQPSSSASCIRAASQAVKSGSCQRHCTTKVS